MPDMICPQCKNPIYDEEALSCHFCGGSLKRSSSGIMGKMRGKGMQWVWIAVAALIALAMVMTIFF
ncbi:MAG: hypothetical protein HQL16_06790 [Candidatus Omnitrophica bacterium]|nr:hypothetical protein [Candidatus Omnitrophota bacterium]